MNHQEYEKQQNEIDDEIVSLEAQIRSLEKSKIRLKANFIESMQAQGWAYAKGYLLSPTFLEQVGATRETIEGTYKVSGQIYDYADEFHINWNRIGEAEGIYI